MKQIYGIDNAIAITTMYCCAHYELLLCVNFVLCIDICKT